jgi:hypothetical protein
LRWYESIVSYSVRTGALEQFSARHDCTSSLNLAAILRRKVARSGLRQ